MYNFILSLLRNGNVMQGTMKCGVTLIREALCAHGVFVTRERIIHSMRQVIDLVGQLRAAVHYHHILGIIEKYVDLCSRCSGVELHIILCAINKGQ